LGYLFGHGSVVKNDLAHVSGQFVKVLLPYSETGHLLNSRSQTTGRRKAFIIGRPLVVNDDIVLFQPLCDLRSLSITDPNDNLVGLRISDSWISLYLQPMILQSTGESLGIGNHGLLVVQFEGVHLIGCQEKTQECPQMMVAEASGENTAPDGVPQLLVLRPFGHVAGDHAALGTKVGLMSRACDDIYTFFERFGSVVR
jgi:hypothetical protein